MNESNTHRQPGADAVYALTKRRINELAQLALDLSEHRDPRVEDPRDKQAYDALDDVRQLSVELCVLWDSLWETIGAGRPDPVVWSNRAYAAIDPDEEDLFVARKGA